MADTLWYNKDNDQDDAKSELEINDTVDDDLIDNYGLKANRKIDNLVFSILDDIPETDTANITNELKQAAIFEIARRYKVKLKSFESAKEYKEDFDSIIESVKRRARATPTDRTKTLLISKDPRDSKVFLPTQSSILAFDDFP